MRVGSLTGGQHTHNVSEAKDESPDYIETLADTLGHIEAHSAFKKVTEESGTYQWNEREIEQYQKDEYPLGGREVQGFPREIPSNRVGG